MKTFTQPNRSEVDIRVAQEIKNHKDLMYEAHQKINALNEGIVSLSLMHEKSKAQLAQQGQSLLVSFENMKENVDSILKNITQRVGDVESKLFTLLDEFNDLKEEISIQYLTKEDFDEAHDNLERNIVSNHLKNSLKSSNLNDSFLQMQARASEDLKSLREELAPKPPEIDKAELDEKFQLWKVDFAGLVKEIALLKKAVSYDQKKFENIYTLIERLKEGKECHKKA